jgi:hypothetical protein
MNNQTISIIGCDAHMNSSESKLCCNPLCQLYDPMSAISFMRECISEPVNPWSTFNHKKQLSIHFITVFISIIIKFENTKIFPLLHFTNQLQPYLLQFIITLHITLVCIFPRHKIF